MDNNTMADIILNYVKKHSGVSFVEVENLFIKHGFDFRGEHILGTPIPNTVLWINWNIDAIRVMTRVIQMGAEFNCTSPLVYYHDGIAPALPIARTAQGYNELHWLPVVINYNS
ncbi:MAG: hypothetical protein IJL67_05465 [Oscillospiraceae bacterium]|nr:hypothetical protein [Oscillospiraceae bacterium]